MYLPVDTGVALYNLRKMNWVRFGKRTQKWGVKRGSAAVLTRFWEVFGVKDRGKSGGLTFGDLRSYEVRGRETGAQQKVRTAQAGRHRALPYQRDTVGRLTLWLVAI